MKLALPIVVMVVLAIIALGVERANAADDEQITVVIPLNYLSAAVAAQIFGGNVIPASPYFGGSFGSPRGGYGSYAGGTGIGGARGMTPPFGGYGNSYGGNGYGGYGGVQSGYGYPR